MDWHEWIYPAGVLLAGYLVLGITGFGSALVTVPLLVGRQALNDSRKAECSGAEKIMPPT